MPLSVVHLGMVELFLFLVEYCHLFSLIFR